MRRLAAVAIGIVALSGCATIPAGPSVMVLPGSGKNFEQFQADDAVCRQWSMQQTGTTTESASGQSAVSGAAIGTVLGAAAGAAIGAAAGNPGAGAAVGAGAGLLGGTAVGGSRGYGAERSVQSRYDMAYMQCMYAKGNQIPVRGAVPQYRSAAPSPPAPPPPPPPAPPAPPASVPPPPPGSPPPPPPGPSR